MQHENGNRNRLYLYQCPSFRRSAAEAKNAFTQAVTAELEKEFGLSKNSMYINITEMSAWGMGGGFHSM